MILAFEALPSALRWLLNRVPRGSPVIPLRLPQSIEKGVVWRVMVEIVGELPLAEMAGGSEDGGIV